MILSRSFFNKPWPELELNALIARMTYEDRELILPIWHEIEIQEVLRYSPLLSGIRALNTKIGLDSVANEVLKIVHKPFEITSTNVIKGKLVDLSEDSVNFYRHKAINSRNSDVQIAALRAL